jgi:uncharacterized protein YndB with AHSA1/START domain
MTRATNKVAVELELRIEASPRTVYSFLTHADKLTQWMGEKAEFDLRPRGAIRLDYGGGHVMRGEFLELVPDERVVISWGWESDATPPPGQSRVTFTLTPDGEATLLKLVHEELTEEEAKTHAEGWDYFLPRLAAAAAGRDPARDEK